MAEREALREIAGVLDALNDDFRIGVVALPERQLLGRIGRTDLLHPSLTVTHKNGRPAPVKHRER